MSVAVWPSELPDPVRASYSQELQDARLRRAAGGPPAFRRRFSSTARLVNLGVELTRARKAIFDNFYDDTTKDGTLPFWMPDPTTEGLALLDGDFGLLLSGAGAPLQIGSTWLCIFGDQVPSETIVGGRYLVNFSVAVMP